MIQIRTGLSDPGAIAACLADALPCEGIGVAQLTQQVLLDPNWLPDGSLAAMDDDRVVGYCLAIARQTPLENAPDDSDRGYITLIAVRPTYRRQGIGARLLRAGEEFLRSQHRRTAMVSSYAPGYFLPGVDVHAYEDGLRFLLSHGYEEVYRPLAMEAPLWSLQKPEWVSARELALSGEIRFTAYEPRLTIPLLEFVRRAFPGDWVRVVREAAREIVGGQAHPSRLIVATRELNGEPEVVAFSHYRGERFGPIGVDPAERGKGIGQVLLYRTLEAQREAAHRVAWFLWSDDRTADRLYRAAGFREVRRFALLRKDLGPVHSRP